jgi:hypothetical protein
MYVAGNREKRSPRRLLAGKRSRRRLLAGKEESTQLIGGKARRKQTLGRPTLRYNIIQVAVIKVVWGGVDGNYLVQNSGHWRALVNSVMNNLVL